MHIGRPWSVFLYDGTKRDNFSRRFIPIFISKKVLLVVYIFLPILKGTKRRTFSPLFYLDVYINHFREYNPSIYTKKRRRTFIRLFIQIFIPISGGTIRPRCCV